MTEAGENLVKKFLDEKSHIFFPNQKIIYFKFEDLNIIIQTIFEKDEEDFLKQRELQNGVPIIEYKVSVNYVPDTTSVGSDEELSDRKIIDPNLPFKLSIESQLTDEEEIEYLQKFKELFDELIGMLSLIAAKEKNI